MQSCQNERCPNNSTVVHCFEVSGRDIALCTTCLDAWTHEVEITPDTPDSELMCDNAEHCGNEADGEITVLFTGSVLRFCADCFEFMLREDVEDACHCHTPKMKGYECDH